MNIAFSAMAIRRCCCRKNGFSWKIPDLHRQIGDFLWLLGEQSLYWLNAVSFSEIVIPAFFAAAASMVNRRLSSS